MNTIFALSLIVSVMVTLLYPVFHLMVTRCRSFGFNRFSILSVLALAIIMSVVYLQMIDVIIPVVHADGSVLEPLVADQSRESPIDIMGPQTKEAGYVDLMILPCVIIAYWVGIAVLIVRQIFAYARLRSIIAKSDRSGDEDGIVVCSHSDSGLSPFSWGKYIVFPRDGFDPAIFVHEKAHTLKKHWVDVMVADLLCIFLWYNPFVWMTRRLIKLNHECEADAAVVDTYMDRIAYQRLLINKALGARRMTVVNNFSMKADDFSRRVRILCKPRSSKRARWILTSVIPAMAIVLVLQANVASAALIRSVEDCRTFFGVRNEKPELTTVLTENHSVGNIMEDKRRKIYGIEKGTVEIEKLLPSPLTDPEPLRRQFKVSFEMADRNVMPDKLLVNIEADEEGRIVSVSSDHDSNPKVRLTIEKAINGVGFEVIRDNGQKVRTRFVLPINLSEFKAE